MATAARREDPGQIVRLRPVADGAPGPRGAAVDRVEFGARLVSRVMLGSGWQFSIHGEGITRLQRACPHPHEGVVAAGVSRILGADGSEVLLRPGDVYTVAGGHDWRVEGDEPVVVLGLGAATAACVDAEGESSP